MMETEYTTQHVYVVYEYLSGADDRIVTIFPDEPETLADVIRHHTSDRYDGAFHAAAPGRGHMDHGDHYLRKHHGVTIAAMQESELQK